MKTLKNIEGKNEQQLNAIKNITIKKWIDSFNKTSLEAEKLMSKIKEEQKAIDSKILIFMGANKKYIDFRVFKGPYEFPSIIYHKGSLKDAKDPQNMIENNMIIILILQKVYGSLKEMK